MNKIMKGLGTMVLAAYAGCASQPQAVEAPKTPAKVEVTKDYLTLGDSKRAEARQDKAYSAQEVSDVIFQYQTLKMSVPDKKADAELKKHYNASVAECEKIINEAFDNTDVYAYVGLVSDKASGNKRANYGGSLPLYVGKGKDVAEQLNIKQKIELLLKASPEWKQYAAKDGVISTADVYNTSMGIDRKLFTQMLNARKAFGVQGDANSHYIDNAVLAAITDGKTETNCELRDNHLRLRAVYAGHSFAEPEAAKK